jgi:integrase
MLLMEQLTFDQLKKTIHEYLTVYCVQDGQTKGTIRGKEELFNRFLTFLNGRPFNLETVRAFQVYLHEGKWKKDSSKDCLARRLRALVNYCYEQELFEKNWAKKIMKPRLHRQVIEVVKEEVAMQIIIAGTTPEPFENAFCRRSKVETRLACEFMLYTGCRVHEVELMKGTDLRLDADVPYVIIHSKGGDVEMQPVPQVMIPELRKRVKNNRLFLFTAKGANTALRRGSKILDIKNIKTSCHRLRDVFALTRLRNGVPLQLVSRALRHDSVKTTDRYYSNYVLSDIAPVVNNSNLIKQRMTPNELLDELLRLIQKAGLNDHEEFKLQTSTSKEGVHIDALFKLIDK